ncbi:hypothetical protein GGR51DRAFT_44502 [Nemania sp. FL0031]|nr:hypothetical protein GGR51DRAFT_44502 [Nemania sp. FL0031]
MGLRHTSSRNTAVDNISPIESKDSWQLSSIIKHTDSYVSVTGPPAVMDQYYETIDPEGDLEIILGNFPTISDLDDAAESCYLRTSAGEPYSDKEAQSTTIFIVSLKHIASASPYFKGMLPIPWSRPWEDGRYRWRIEGFDAEAMAIVLNVIHGKSSRLPQQIDLDTLVEVARIVDCMKCHEVIAVYANRWIDDLEPGITKSYNAELLLWICIAGVFRKRDIFERCTRIAIFANHSGIATFGLPILPELSDEINRRRVYHLDQIFATVYKFIDDLSKGTKCRLRCDALRLGVLTKYLYATSFNSRPQSPYTRMSVSRAVNIFNCLPPLDPLMKEVKKSVDTKCGFSSVVSSDQWEPAIKGDPDWDTLRLHCGLYELIGMVNRVEFGIKGLELEDLDSIW